MHKLALALLLRPLVVAVAVAVVAMVGAIAVIVHCLAFNVVVVGVVVVVAGSLCLQLRYRVSIVISDAQDVALFLCSAAIRFGFGGSGWVRRCSGG